MSFLWVFISTHLVSVIDPVIVFPEPDFEWLGCFKSLDFALLYTYTENGHLSWSKIIILQLHLASLSYSCEIYEEHDYIVRKELMVELKTIH